MNSQIHNENQVHSIGLTESGEQLITGLTGRGGIMKRVRLLSIAGDEQPARGFLIRRLVPVIFLGLAVALLSASTASAANRFSVATGNWNAISTWSATSGGGSGASVPVAGDVVTVEGGFNVTLTADAACTTLSIIQVVQLLSFQEQLVP